MKHHKVLPMREVLTIKKIESITWDPVVRDVLGLGSYWKDAPASRRRPAIGPCRDRFRFWFLEMDHPRAPGIVYRWYFANRDEARAALREVKAQ